MPSNVGLATVWQYVFAIIMIGLAVIAFRALWVFIDRMPVGRKGTADGIEVILREILSTIRGQDEILKEQWSQHFVATQKERELSSDRWKSTFGFLEEIRQAINLVVYEESEEIRSKELIKAISKIGVAKPISLEPVALQLEDLKDAFEKLSSTQIQMMRSFFGDAVVPMDGSLSKVSQEIRKAAEYYMRQGMPQEEAVRRAEQILAYNPNGQGMRADG
jgi:hypothetical protein